MISQLCEQKSVKHAYHVICDKCANERSECGMCRTKRSAYELLHRDGYCLTASSVNPDEEEQDAQILAEASGKLRERDRRQLARVLESKGEHAAVEYLRTKLDLDSLGQSGDEDFGDEVDDEDEADVADTDEDGIETDGKIIEAEGRTSAGEKEDDDLDFDDEDDFDEEDDEEDDDE